MMNKPLAIANKPFRAMKVNPSKERSFYTQGQQRIARILLAVWLAASISTDSTLAAPDGQATVVPAHHSDALATSSAANPTLQQLMSQKGVPDNKTLVAALNAATLEEQSQWIEKAVEWFKNPLIVKYPAAIQDYAKLAHIQVTPENRDLLADYLNSLCNKVKDKSFGEELFIQALAYVLAHLDPAIFAGDPQLLLTLGGNLLAKLDPSQRVFKQADYPSARATLEALSQTLFLVHEVAPGYLNVQDGGLYQSFRSQLQKIIDRAQYYPAIYQARLLKQTLRLLEDPESDGEGNMRRIAQGLLGVVNLVTVGQGLATGELKPAELQDGIKLLKAAFHGQRIQPKPWHDQLLTLEGKMLHCLQERDLKAYPDSKTLKDTVQAINSLSLSLKSIATNKAPQYRQALRFGIAMQLQILSLKGPTPEIRTGSIERLIALGKPEAWGSDTNVMAGLLDGLALVAVQSEAARAEEATKAHEVLKALADESLLVSSGQPSRLGQLFRHPHSPQDTASKAFSAWLGNKGLSDKLQCFRDQAAGKGGGMFSHVRQMLRQTVISESFGAPEIKDLTQIIRYIDLEKLRHFVERIDTTKKLTKILQEEGICALSGFGGVGKSTLAAQYGRECKDVQIVHWILAENSIELQKGYKKLAQDLEVNCPRCRPRRRLPGRQTRRCPSHHYHPQC